MARADVLLELQAVISRHPSKCSNRLTRALSISRNRWWTRGKSTRDETISTQPSLAEFDEYHALGHAFDTRRTPLQILLDTISTDVMQHRHTCLSRALKTSACDSTWSRRQLIGMRNRNLAELYPGFYVRIQYGSIRHTTTGTIATEAEGAISFRLDSSHDLIYLTSDIQASQNKNTTPVAMHA